MYVGDVCVWVHEFKSINISGAKERKLYLYISVKILPNIL